MTDRVAVIIPCLDEEQSIGLVVGEIPRDVVAEVVVVDNGSADRSAEVARAAGARVVREEHRGYGAACLRGIAAVGDGADVIVFLDGDRSFFIEDLPRVVGPVLVGEADLVLGSRMILPGSRAHMPPQSLFGNRLACRLLRLFFGIEATDLGPFRAIRRQALAGLGMRDRDFGWTIEMQIRAKRAGLRVVEVPIGYRERIGTSKITGTLRGTLGAGFKILWTIASHARA
jgi:glycosyltransferase involved in cell wall biosynthesis